MIRVPLRKVVDDRGATVVLECGHITDRRPGYTQPKRRQCVTCLPIDERRAVMRAKRK